MEERRAVRHTHAQIHTDEAGKISREADFVGMKPTSVGRERES